MYAGNVDAHFADDTVTVDCELVSFGTEVSEHTKTLDLRPTNSFNICEMGCVNPRPKAVRTREHATLPTDTCIIVDLFGGNRH